MKVLDDGVMLMNKIGQLDRLTIKLIIIIINVNSASQVSQISKYQGNRFSSKYC